VDDEVMQEFRRYLAERNIRYSEPDVQQSLDWIKLRIKKEIFLSAFGRDEGQRVAVTGDVMVQRAIELLPQAKELAEKTRRIIAQREKSQ